MKTLEQLAGAIYPWRIMAQGTLDDMVWWVVNPQGKKVSKWQTPLGAQSAAELSKSGHLRG